MTPGPPARLHTLRRGSQFTKMHPSSTPRHLSWRSPTSSSPTSSPRTARRVASLSLFPPCPLLADSLSPRRILVGIAQFDAPGRATVALARLHYTDVRRHPGPHRGASRDAAPVPSYRALRKRLASRHPGTFSHFTFHTTSSFTYILLEINADRRGTPGCPTRATRTAS